MATFKNLIDNLNGSLAADAQDRNSLRNHFLRGKIPREDHFHSAINSSLNLIDDGLFKTTDSPLCIKAASGDTTRSVLHFYGDMDTEEPAWQLGIEGGHLHFTTPTDGTHLTINKNGNVGIGTNSPEAPLEIRQNQNSGSDRGLVISEPNNSQKIYLHLANNASGEYGYLHLGGTTSIRGNGIHSSFDGKVGIGTTNPQRYMHVSQLDASAQCRLERKGNNPGITDFGTDEQGLYFWLGGYDGHSNAEFFIKQDGNVGIGTTTPGAKLEVNGDLKVGLLSAVSWHNPTYGWRNNSFIMNGIRRNGEWQLWGDTARSSIGIITTDIFSNIRFISHHDNSKSNGKTMTDDELIGGGNVKMTIAHNGNVSIAGTFTGSGGKSFLIDHPLDPENKTLRHYAVESPEVLCLYRGRVSIGKNGQKQVQLPDYFTVLTKAEEATVTLTPIGKAAKILSYEWKDDFTAFIVYGAPESEATYMVLADRNDPAMTYNCKPVEEEKGGDNFEKGTYINAKEYEQAVKDRLPRVMKHLPVQADKLEPDYFTRRKFKVPKPE